MTKEKSIHEDIVRRAFIVEQALHGDIVEQAIQGDGGKRSVREAIKWAMEQGYAYGMESGIAAEREACAKVCDGISEDYKTRTDLNKTQKQVGQLAAELCGVKIRGAAMNLRKAAEMALECLEFHWDKEETDWEAHPDHVVQAKRALRQALAQPEREWVNLTEKEIVEATHFVRGVYDSARAIEAKLKQKNEPA